MTRGFTLAEVIVVTALLAILMTLGVGIFLSNNRFYETQTGEVTSINSTRQAGDKINEYTRTALAFVTSRVHNSITYTAGAQTLILQLPAVDSSSEIIAGVYDYVIVSIDPNNSSRLILIVDSNPFSDRPAQLLELTNKLSILNFTYDNADLALARKVNYQIKVQETTRYPASEEVFGAASLRNK